MSKADPAHRTPSELRILYLTEPVHDVIAEGRSDAALVKWYLREVGISNVGTYAIDDRVHIDSSAVTAVLGAEVGSRGRLLALAESASSWGAPANGLTCLIDLDRDCLANQRFEADTLIRTDYGSIDVYSFQERPLQQLFDVALRRNDSAKEVIEELTPPLNRIFVVRAALHDLAVPLVNTFASCVSFKSAQADVDIEELTRRSLAAGKRSDEFGHTLAHIEQLGSQLPEDRLQAVRGHDVAPLLVARLRLKNEWARPDYLEAAMRTCLSVNDIESFPFFRAIHRRVTAHL